MISECIPCIKKILSDLNSKEKEEKKIAKKEFLTKVDKMISNYKNEQTEPLLLLFTEIAKIDRSANLKLVICLVHSKKLSQLEELHNQLLKEKDYESAAFASAFLNDDKLFSSLSQGKLFSKLTVFSKSSNQKMEEFLEGWNNQLAHFNKSVTIIKT